MHRKKHIFSVILTVIFVITLFSEIVQAYGKENQEEGEMYNNTFSSVHFLSFSFLQTDPYSLPLDGARYALFYDRECTKLISEAESGAYPSFWGRVIFENVPFPASAETLYYMRQISPPQGYLLRTGLYLVRVEDDSEGNTAVFIKAESGEKWKRAEDFYIKNMPASRAKGTLCVSLSTEGTASSWKNFSLVVYDENGNYVDSLLLAPNGNAVTKLEPGNYMFRYKASVDGYDALSSINGVPSANGEFSFTVKVDDETQIHIKTVFKPRPSAVTHKAYIAGYPDNTFRPCDTITRAEAAVMLARLMEEESPFCTSFSDVDKSRWYYESVYTLADAGIVSGYPDGTFRPDNPVTRAELVKTVLLFLNIPNVSGTSRFPDISNHWAKIFIETAQTLGIVHGYDDGRFAPDRFVTRAEATAILNRALGRGSAGDCPLFDAEPFSDVPADAWYYHDVCEAVYAH